MKMMFRYIAGILTALLFIGSVFGLLYIFDQYDYIDLKPSVLVSLSRIPGWEEVAEAYKLGLENRDHLINRQEELDKKQEELVKKEKEIEAEKELLLKQTMEFQEKEEALEYERRKVLTEVSRMETNRTVNKSASDKEKYETAARLLESMSPAIAGENLIKMPFEMGVSVLSLLEPRKAGKILESIPPEKSALYMEKISTN